jgi:hypothetical protein
MVVTPNQAEKKLEGFERCIVLECGDENEISLGLDFDSAYSGFERKYYQVTCSLTAWPHVNTKGENA